MQEIVKFFSFLINVFRQLLTLHDGFRRFMTLFFTLFLFLILCILFQFLCILCVTLCINLHSLYRFFAKYTFSPKQFLCKQRLNTEVKKHNDSQYDSVVTKHFKIMFSDILHEELDRKDGNKRNDRSQQKQKYLHTREI